MTMLAKAFWIVLAMAFLALPVKAEQIKLGLPADSYPTPELVQRLQGR